MSLKNVLNHLQINLDRHPNGIAVEELAKEYRTNLGGDLDEAVANYAGGVREMVRLGGYMHIQWCRE